MKAQLLAVLTMITLLLPKANALSGIAGFNLKVDFTYKTATRDLHVKSTTLVSQQNEDWIALAPAKDGVALIGRVMKGGDGILTVEYMVVDTSEQPVALQRMGVVAKFGQAAEIKSDSLPQKVKISMIATADNIHQPPCEGLSQIPTTGCQSNEIE